MRTAIHIKDDNNNPKISENSMQQLMAYNYDQLNRITRTRNIELESGKFQITNKYQENYSYDPNGNILTLDRTNGQGQLFDRLHYGYNISVNNQLQVVEDEGSDADAVPNDLDAYESYRYDEIGNLIELQTPTEISRMTWTIYGKLATVEKQNWQHNLEIIITYTYDAMGNRVRKEVSKHNNSGWGGGNANYQTTYWRDAQGNVLKTQTTGSATDLNGTTQSKNSEEFVIYGSSRLGTYSPVYNVFVNQFFGITENTLTLGYKAYELSNHLGNVLTTISDNYYTQNSTAEVAARVLSSQDYFPFGMVMTERSFQEKQERKYRFGFNGKENDEDLEGQDYGLRIYKPSLGRMFTPDPLGSKFAWNSSYAFAENDVIRCGDLEGGEKKITINSPWWTKLVQNIMTDENLNRITKEAYVAVCIDYLADLKFANDYANRAITPGYDVLVVSDNGKNHYEIQGLTWKNPQTQKGGADLVYLTDMDNPNNDLSTKISIFSARHTRDVAEANTDAVTDAIPVTALSKAAFGLISKTKDAFDRNISFFDAEGTNWVVWGFNLDKEKKPKEDGIDDIMSSQNVLDNGNSLKKEGLKGVGQSLKQPYSGGWMLGLGAVKTYADKFYPGGFANIPNDFVNYLLGELTTSGSYEVKMATIQKIVKEYNPENK